MDKKKIRIILAFALPVLLITGIFFAFVYLKNGMSLVFGQIRNERRFTQAVEFADAIQASKAENGGFFPERIEYLQEGLYYQLGQGNDCDDPCFYPTVSLEKECVDIKAIPGAIIATSDTEKILTGHSGYYLLKNFDSSFVVGSCNEEIGSYLGGVPEEIEVRR